MLIGPIQKNVCGTKGKADKIINAPSIINIIPIIFNGSSLPLISYSLYFNPLFSRTF